MRIFNRWSTTLGILVRFITPVKSCHMRIISSDKKVTYSKLFLHRWCQVRYVCFTNKEPSIKWYQNQYLQTVTKIHDSSDSVCEKHPKFHENTCWSLYLEFLSFNLKIQSWHFFIEYSFRLESRWKNKKKNENFYQ